MSELKKPQKYRDKRSSERFTRYHEWTRANRPDWVYGLVRILVTLPMLVLYRPRTVNIGNFPADGPVLLAVNHLSNLDHFFVAMYLRRHLNFMGKSQLFVGGVVSFILCHGGVFPVRRGAADAEAFKTAYSVLGRGHPLLIYPEGGRSRTGRPVKARTGVGRLALESGVPVVPVAVHGSADIREWRRGRFPAVTVHYGEPLSFDIVDRPSREVQQEAADKIFDRVIAMYDEIDRDGRKAVIARESAKH